MSTANSAATNQPPRSIPRSIGAVLLGFVVVFVLSLGVDQILHMLDVYPPWGQPMWEPGLNALALSALPCTWLGGVIQQRRGARS